MNLQHCFAVTFLLFFLNLSASAGPIELPDIGDSAGAVISPDKERELGAAFMRHIRRSAKVLDDMEAEDYLVSLGRKIASHSDRSPDGFRFFLVDEPSINAFAGPGGYIGAHTGLFLNSRTESELAGVIAHEIAHATQHHMARTFERAGQLSIPVAAAMLGAVLLGVASPDAGQAALAAVAAGSAQYQINFTRANEQEADRVGIGLLAEAGFDPQGMPSFFERLQVANRLTDPKNLPEFLRTHPVTVSRIADSRSRVAQLPPAAYVDSLDYHLVRAKLEVAAAKTPLDAIKQYEADLRWGEYYNEDVARYGYALALTRGGEYGKARVHIAHLLDRDGNRPAYMLAAARLAEEDGAVEEALAYYRKTLSLHPDNRAASLGSIGILLDINAIADARRLLEDYIKHHAPDLPYYVYLAEAEGRGGSPIESHIALAESFYIQGEVERARDQLKIAQKQGTLSYYHRERIAARLKELEEELEEAEENS